MNQSVQTNCQRVKGHYIFKQAPLPSYSKPLYVAPGLFAMIKFLYMHTLNIHEIIRLEYITIYLLNFYLYDNTVRQALFPLSHSSFIIQKIR